MTVYRLTTPLLEFEGPLEDVLRVLRVGGEIHPGEHYWFGGDADITDSDLIDIARIEFHRTDGPIEFSIERLR